MPSTTTMIRPAATTPRSCKQAKDRSCKQDRRPGLEAAHDRRQPPSSPATRLLNATRRTKDGVKACPTQKQHARATCVTHPRKHTFLATPSSKIDTLKCIEICRKTHPCLRAPIQLFASRREYFPVILLRKNFKVLIPRVCMSTASWTSSVS